MSLRECWVKDGCTINKAHLKEKLWKAVKSSNSLILHSRLCHSKASHFIKSCGVKYRK